MSKVVMMKPIAALALASLLSACMGNNATEQPKRPVDPNANIAVRAGYTSPIKGDPGRAGYDSMVDAGLAAGMAQDFGAAGLGLGVLGWLASSDYHPWKYERLLTEITPSTDLSALEKRVAEAGFIVTGDKPEQDGYTRITDPKRPNAVVFIKPGCEHNRFGYYKDSCSKVYGGVITDTDDPRVKTVNTAGVGANMPLATYYRKIAEALPRDLTLYVPPRIEGSTFVPPQLVKGGKATSF